MSNGLRRYFSSGWAFLIPYLFAYLLYYMMKWPVNPSGKTQNPELQISNGYIPCLLHVYWTLHALHAILAGFALWSWWRQRSPELDTEVTEPGHRGHRNPASNTSVVISDNQWLTTSDLRPLTSGLRPSALQPFSLSDLLIRLAPWALLALLFYIPGVYLEWPSDPWEHLRRINEWRILDTVGDHSSWHKSAYFIPYSLLSWCTGLRQLFWLDFYYTGICLLLCWQYYKLSRACGLGERASMVFVIIQALLFGNNIFSFYRYYGISSSIYAQLGAIAFTRIFLEWAARGTMLDLLRLKSSDGARQCGDGESRGLRQAARPKRSGGLSERVPTGRNDNNSQYDPVIPSRPWQVAEMHTDTPLAHGSASALRALSPSTFFRSALQSLSHSGFRPTFWHLPPVLWLLALCSLLFAVVALNHQQGIGIAGLGIAAVIVWRLIEWKRSALWWLIAGTITVNALFLWLYPRPPIIETYRTQGWLNAWYGFNIFDLTSLSGDRMLQIISAFGLVNLTAALCLFRRSQVIVWLTVTPLIMLSLPCLAITFAVLANRASGELYIVTFQRLLFAIPIGLAMVFCSARFMHRLDEGRFVDKRWPYNIIYFSLTCIVHAALTVVPSSTPYYNRTWHSNVHIADDLQLRDVFRQYKAVLPRVLNSPELKVITNQAGTALLSCDSGAISTYQSRTIGLPPIVSITTALNILGINAITNAPLNEHEDLSHTSIISPKAISKATAAAYQNLIPDHDARDPTAWIAHGGKSPEFTTEISDLPGVATALQNPAGATSEIFSSAMIPVQLQKSYRLEMKIKNVRGTEGTVYLAVAWYAANGRLLESYVPYPKGAGTPRGWNNGTYSYFGLESQVPPTSWTTFGIHFGLREAAEIPPNAAFVRVGALLNYNAQSSAVIQLTDVRLFEKSTPEIVAVTPKTTSVFSPVAQAALLSTHWPPQQVIVDHGGTKEIQSTADLFRSLKEESPSK